MSKASPLLPAVEETLNAALLALLDARPSNPLQAFAMDAASRLGGLGVARSARHNHGAPPVSREAEMEYLRPIVDDLEMLMSQAVTAAQGLHSFEDAGPLLAAKLLSLAGVEDTHQAAASSMSVPERMAHLNRLYAAVVLQKAVRGRRCRMAFRAVVAEAVAKLSVPSAELEFDLSS